MPVGMIVMRVIVRHFADSCVSDVSTATYIARRMIEYYYSDTAISSSTSGPPPTGNTMNCLPPAM